MHGQLDMAISSPIFITDPSIPIRECQDGPSVGGCFEAVALWTCPYSSAAFIPDVNHPLHPNRDSLSLTHIGVFSFFGFTLTPQPQRNRTSVRHNAPLIPRRIHSHGHPLRQPSLNQRKGAGGRRYAPELTFGLCVTDSIIIHARCSIDIAVGPSAFARLHIASSFSPLGYRMSSGMVKEMYVQKKFQGWQTLTSVHSQVDILVIGAGPTGLGAAKRLNQIVGNEKYAIEGPILLTDLRRTVRHG